jgi:ribosomal protein S18 acetylase RimI-like enzyme
MIVESYHEGLQEALVALLARAFATNPLHLAAFGPERVQERNQAFFRAVLPLLGGKKLVARDGGAVIGFSHWVPTPGCRLPPARKLGVFPALLLGTGFRSARRVGSWLSAWGEHHPRGDHCHLGPIGVDPRRQRTGVGRTLMTAYCEELDAESTTGYLETDRDENVGFYERFGFRVTATASVLGTVSYFMTRPAINSTGSSRT